MYVLVRTSVIAGLLSCLISASAFGADATISSDGVTTTIQSTSARALDLSVGFDASFVGPAGTVDCISSPHCNSFSLQDSNTPTIALGAPCAPNADATVIYCPAAKDLTANLGPGDDHILISRSTDPAFQVSFNTATVHGGDGVDTIEGGLAGPSPGFADHGRFYGDHGDDKLTAGAGDSELHGGEGNDTLTGGVGSDQVFGEAGSDILGGGAGDDTVDGGDGDDVLGLSIGPGGFSEADTGADTYAGGPGLDRLTYQDAQSPVNVSLDGAANDGPNENDNVVSDVEQVEGSNQGDVLTGSPANETFVGAGGDDTITGGPGKDSLYGDAQSCRSVCPVGNDSINTDDGEADQVTCGPGADSATGDALDTFATDPINACETVRIVATPLMPTVVPTTPVPLPSAPAPSLTASCSNGFTVRVTKPRAGTAGLRRHGLVLTALCRAYSRATASASVGRLTARRLHLLGPKSKRHSLVIATGAAAVSASGTARITLRLTRAARAAFRRLRSVSVLIRVTATDRRGGSRSSNKTVHIG